MHSIGVGKIKTGSVLCRYVLNDANILSLDN